MASYNILDGSARYESIAMPNTVPSPGQPTRNCESDMTLSQAGNGKPCAMLLFPFIGRSEVGCSSDTSSGVQQYSRCRPIVLGAADGLSRSINGFARLLITAAIAWLIWRKL